MEIRALLSAMWRSRVGPVLVAAQVAVTLAVVVNVSYIVQTRLENISQPTGLDMDNMFWVVSVAYTPEFNRVAAIPADVAWLQSLPGVVAAANSSLVPQGFGTSSLPFAADASVLDKGGGEPAVLYTGTGQLVQSLGVKLIAGRMFDPANKFQVVFDSPETVETLEYVKSLQPYMPKGAVSYSFLEVTDAIVTGKTAMAFYWGRPYGRAFEENKAVFANLESFNHARHPKTGLRMNWNDFQGWCVPKANNPFIDEVKAALAYYQTSPQWLVRYCHSLVPNVSPTYQDVLDDPQLQTHPFFQTKKRTIDTYYTTSVPHSSSTANELLKGVNPLAGIVHGRSILAETVQKVVLENVKAADAAKWGHAQLEQVRKEHIHLVL